MILGHGLTVKALAVANTLLLDIKCPGVVSTLQLGDEQKDIAEFIAQFRNDGGEIA